MSTTHVAAIDLGATSGRVIVGTYDGKRLELDEVHRFPNGVRTLNNNCYWDIGGFFDHICTGLKNAVERYPDLLSCGVDTWAVDYAMLDGNGRLAYPVHAYRDERSRPIMEAVINKGDEDAFYQWTGIAFLPFNTCFQLAETLQACPSVRESVKHVLHLPDYLNYLLCGKMVNEISNIGSGQLMDVNSTQYAQAVFDYFDIPRTWFSEPQRAGQILGKVKNLPGLEQVNVALVPGHDTACAFEAIPRIGNDLIVSVGTWMLPGAITEKPATGEIAFKSKCANERTGLGGYRPNRPTLGMWLLEQIFPQFPDAPKHPEQWSALIDAASQMPASKVLIDLTDQQLFNPKDMKTAIETQIRSNGGTPPADLIGYMRLICDSLGKGIADARKDFAEATGTDFDHIILVGGGSKNQLLCQRAADYAGIPATSFNLEGTAVGNIAYQLLAHKIIDRLDAFHAVIAKDIEKHTYQPNPC